MNRKLIFQLSAFGLIMALGTIALIPEKIEPAFWLVIFIICAWIIAKAAAGKYFLHGFLVCLVNCVWIVVVHTLFYNTYIAHHPNAALMNAGAPISMANHPRLVQALFGPVFGVVSGLVLGLFSLIASKFVKKA